MDLTLGVCLELACIIFHPTVDFSQEFGECICEFRKVHERIQFYQRLLCIELYFILLFGDGFDLGD